MDRFRRWLKQSKATGRKIWRKKNPLCSCYRPFFWTKFGQRKYRKQRQPTSTWFWTSLLSLQYWSGPWPRLEIATGFCQVERLEQLYIIYPKNLLGSALKSSSFSEGGMAVRQMGAWTWPTGKQQLIRQAVGENHSNIDTNWLQRAWTWRLSGKCQLAYFDPEQSIRIPLIARRNLPWQKTYCAHTPGLDRRYPKNIRKFILKTIRATEMAKAWSNRCRKKRKGGCTARSPLIPSPETCWRSVRET